jgi:glycine/D-amino acid oxidase-like deaminating enzyme/nitrite reductase/ring-hydroxylating ferredoxin subunit
MDKNKENYPEDHQLTSGRHVSYWVDTSPVMPENPLMEHLETEVVIVGAGIAGLSVAYCLVQAGKKVVVVDDGLIGSGETGRTTGHLTAALDDGFYELEKIFGTEDCKILAQSHTTAIDFVERTCKKENIECDFERLPAYLFRHPSDQEDALERELEAAQRAGLDVREMKLTPGKLIAEKCLVFADQAQFHVMKYLAGLARVIQQQGGQIYTGTHATTINDEGIETKQGFTVRAKHIVVATNSPVNDLVWMAMKQYPHRTYVIGALIKKGTLPHALWWDTGNYEVDPKIPPYHYVRVHPYDVEHDLIIVGGEDHPVGDTSDTEVSEEDRYSRIEDWARNHFPMGEVIYQWSGQIVEPMDGVAYIGRYMGNDNIFIATGDSGNGLTHGTIAGILISDLILGNENPWEKVYRPSRIKLKKSGLMFKQLIQGMLAVFKRKPHEKGAKDLNEIKNGEGKVVNMLDEQFGVYRDDMGKLHIVSPVCTHLKCTVGWNADESTWDCPCHGSRFSYQGKVLNGPANSDLDSYSEGELEKKIEEKT